MTVFRSIIFAGFLFTLPCLADGTDTGQVGQHPTDDRAVSGGCDKQVSQAEGKEADVPRGKKDSGAQTPSSEAT